MNYGYVADNELLTIVHGFLTISDYKEKYSKILLEGKWLQDLGFTIGKEVSVKIINEDNKNKLIVSLVD